MRLSDVNEAFYNRVLDAGSKADEGAVNTILHTMTIAYGNDVRQVANEWLPEAYAEIAAFRERLRAYWGHALDMYVVTANEFWRLGYDYAEANQDECRAAWEAGFNALWGLHQKACRIAFEVHALLSNGFPYGALALARSLHEIRVVARFIAEAGPSTDVAERFNSHHAVSRWKDAVEYQKHAERLGHIPLAASELTEIEADCIEVKRRYGNDFARPYGWAHKQLGVKGATLRTIEESVNLDHIRGYYSWASHHLHPTSKGVYLNLVRKDGQQRFLAGPTNAFLADPAMLALTSIGDIAVSFIMETHPQGHENPGVVITMGALNDLIDAACDLLTEADKALMRDEASGSLMPDATEGSHG